MKIKTTFLLIAATLFFGGCAHHGVINPTASYSGANYYNCNRPIALNEAASNATITDEHFMQSYQVNLGQFLANEIKLIFQTEKVDQKPILLQPTGSFVKLGKTSFSDSTVRIALSSDDLSDVTPEGDQMIYAGLAGEPLGFASLGGMLGQLGLETITYPVLHGIFARSANTAAQQALVQFGDHMVEKKVCQLVSRPPGSYDEPSKNATTNIHKFKT